MTPIMGDKSAETSCPSFGGWIVSEAVVCLSCGYDRRQQRRLGTIVKRALLLPRVSGVQSFFVLLLCMGVTALVVPMALRFPLWIDVEIVIAGWWVIWCIALTLFLYNGWLVTHDFKTPTFSNPLAKKPEEKKRSDYHRGWWDGYWWGSLDFGGSVEGGEAILGCLLLLLLIIAMPFILVFLVEAAVGLTFVCYFLVRGMLAQVANARGRRAQGRLLPSLGQGVLWATVYTAPLAGLVWFVHWLHR